MPSATFVALLRGINVTGRNTIAMAALCKVCEGLGWVDVRTYIQSGNVVFRTGVRPSAAAAAKLEAALEGAIEKRFKLSIPVIVRPSGGAGKVGGAGTGGWSAYAAGNPFAEESEREPNRVMLALSKAAPKAGAVEALRERAVNGERLEQAADAIWIHYPSGAGQSKLSPALFDRLVGSSVTARNWRTVLKIEAMMREAAAGAE